MLLCIDYTSLGEKSVNVQGLSLEMGEDANSPYPLGRPSVLLSCCFQVGDGSFSWRREF